MNPSTENIPALMQEIAAAAKDAARTLAGAPAEAKNRALNEAAGSLRGNAAALLDANAKDMDRGREKGLTASLLDRMALDEMRIEAMAAGLDQIAALEDPVGHVMDHWQRPNGLDISRVRVPLGVIGIIYESRPNVTADAGSLCLKSGNASILRGGSESFHSSSAILDCMHEGLKLANLPGGAIQMGTTDGGLWQLAESYRPLVVDCTFEGNRAVIDHDTSGTDIGSLVYPAVLNDLGKTFHLVETSPPVGCAAAGADMCAVGDCEGCCGGKGADFGEQGTAAGETARGCAGEGATRWCGCGWGETATESCGRRQHRTVRGRR